MHMAAKGRLKGDTRPSHETRRPPLGNDTGGLLKQFGRRKSQLARVDLKKFNPDISLGHTAHKEPNYGQLLNGVTKVHQTSQATIKSHFGRQIQKIGRRNHHGS
ncbi:unnamed protein product [Microthlaspi erraticum]|uniref:Uncharacterized protein n=1 Tax=Microthlaspi erraticum TaxID=1685480 RepID=A0A6D2I2L6_9BRAS|nr:unnamed protein product [Microthlaspi erraticum]